MDMLTKEMRGLMFDNGSPLHRDKDHYPVVKLFIANTAACWLLTELDPDEPDIAFGLCDLGLGFPELGYVSVHELAALHGQLGLPVVRDQDFRARYPISVYARAARLAQAITEDVHLLSIAQADAVTSPAPRPGL